MVDLGLYNYIKNALAQGKSREEIVQHLVGAGWQQTLVEEAMTAVEHRDEPTPVRPTLVATGAVAAEAFADGRSALGGRTGRSLAGWVLLVFLVLLFALAAAVGYLYYRGFDFSRLPAFLHLPYGTGF